MRRVAASLAVALATFASVLSFPLAAQAAPAYLPKVSPANGWEVPLEANLSDIGERFSSPAIGDFDGNGVVDIIAGFPNGRIYAWRTDNGARWFEHWTGAGSVQASPGLIDYDRDGRLDLVYANTHGDVGVIAADKRQLFYAKIGGAGQWSGALATPAVSDVNRDGLLDVVVTGFDEYLHAWGPGINPRQLPGFPVHLQDTSWSSPAVGDIDGDGIDEIVVGWDCDGAPGQACYPNYGGWVGAFTGSGQPKPGWPRFVPKQVVWSSPALADLDGDGRKEVVVGTGNMGATMWDGGKQPMRGTQVFAFRGDGSFLPGWPVDVGRNVTSSPAVGDLNGDGRPEVAFVAENGLLYAYSGNGVRLWSRCAGNNVTLPPNDGTVTYGQECPVLHASPTIADVTGDGRQEVLVGGEQWMHVFDGATGNVVAEGETAAGTDPMTATPTVANVNGRTWIVEATTTTSGGFKGRVFAWTTGRALGKADWPTFKRDMTRSSTAPVVLTTYGAIGDKWKALGGEAGLLGKPTTNEYAVRNGRAQRFQGGHIYWSPATGAHEVHGAILDRYLALGAADAPFGLPITDESAVPGGRSSTFQTGTIYWSVTSGAGTVMGAIRDRYLQMGGPGGSFGFPVSDEYVVPGGRGTAFRGGKIFWSLGSGAHPVMGAILARYEGLGGPGSRFGFPVSAEYGVPGGAALNLQVGTIYFSNATGSRVVEGAIRERYLATGGSAGYLGFPTSDEYAVPGGRASSFQGGRIFWSGASGAQPVYGGILAHFERLGGTGGLLGFPTSPELDSPGGRVSVFQGGRVFWSFGTGAREVHGAILGEYLRLGGSGSSLGMPTSDEYAIGVDRLSDFLGGRLRWSGTSGVVTRG